MEMTAFNQGRSNEKVSERGEEDENENELPTSKSVIDQSLSVSSIIILVSSHSGESSRVGPSRGLPLQEEGRKVRTREERRVGRERERDEP